MPYSQTLVAEESKTVFKLLQSKLVDKFGHWDGGACNAMLAH
jgi:hypothetical protein